MKTLKLLTILALAGSTTLIAGNTQAPQNRGNQYNIQIGDGHPPQMEKRQKRRNPNRRINRLLRKLDLTDEQKSQLKKVRQTMQKARKIEMKKQRGSLNLKKFVSVDGFDKEAFVLSSEARAKNMAQVRADMMESIIGTLTADQRVELVEQLNKPRKARRNNDRQRKSRRQNRQPLD
jgi:Spy/CpxP family protein refolding chaperone